MDKLNIGVIGHGVRGRHCLEMYLMQYGPNAAVKRVAFYGKSNPVMLEGAGEAEAREYAAQYSATYCTWEEIIADPEINIISVMVEPAQSYPVIAAALRAGKHVLCDKPHVKTVEDAEILAAMPTEGTLAVFYWVRYLPAVKEAMRRLREDGSRVIAADVELFFGHGPLGGFTMTPEYVDAFGGGELVNFGCYAIDILNCILGTPTDATDTREVAASAVIFPVR